MTIRNVHVKQNCSTWKFLLHGQCPRRPRQIWCMLELLHLQFQYVENIHFSIVHTFQIMIWENCFFFWAFLLQNKHIIIKLGKNSKPMLQNRSPPFQVFFAYMCSTTGFITTLRQIKHFCVWKVHEYMHSSVGKTSCKKTMVKRRMGWKRSSLSSPLSHIWAGRGVGCSGWGRPPCTAWAQDDNED